MSTGPEVGKGEREVRLKREKPRLAVLGCWVVPVCSVDWGKFFCLLI